LVHCIQPAYLKTFLLLFICACVLLL
jgi:hypothetical protein